jgi:hypothetical protein
VVREIESGEAAVTCADDERAEGELTDLPPLIVTPWWSKSRMPMSHASSGGQSVNTVNDVAVARLIARAAGLGDATT